MVLLHGWGCDHSFLEPQRSFFEQAGFRVLSIDLRGHGQSAAPEQAYPMSVFADDVAYLCSKLHIQRPTVVVGHSMGGMISLELAARHPQIPSSLVLIDSLVFPTSVTLEAIAPLREAIRRPDYVEVYRSAVSSLMLPTDSKEIHLKLMERTPCAPQHVLISALDSHFDQSAVEAAASRIAIPVAYVGAATPLGSVERFRNYSPLVMSAQTLGSGHFSPLQVPVQINEMIAAFVSMVEG